MTHDDPLDNLTTESVNLDLSSLDTLSTTAMLHVFNAEDAKVAAAVGREIPNIARAVHKIVHSFRAGGRLIYVGAGTSGRLAVLDASECPPTFGTVPALVQAVIAGGETALRNAVEGAEDDEDAGARAMLDLEVNEHDTVIGISASGGAPFVCTALTRAREWGASTVAVVNNRQCPLGRIAHVTIAPIVGPEVLAGSTRLKSGTSQKLVLNMLTTCAMIETGKTYGNLMVDVQATNKKLVQRAKRIVHQVTGAEEAVIAQALDEAGGSAKLAIVMIARHVDAAAAQELLDGGGGFLRRALGG